MISLSIRIIIKTMRGRKIEQETINQIRTLRKRGNTMSEIKRATSKSNAVISKYIKNVQISPKYLKIWKSKQGGSKMRSEKEWVGARNKASALIDNINDKEKLLILSSLYWGEGAKNDFSLLNTDPNLIKVFINCLEELGVAKDRLKITIRIYEDIDRKKAVSYWAEIIGISKKQISNVNILKGKKAGKLKYGMCRIRIKKGGQCLKLIKSIIELIIKSP